MSFNFILFFNFIIISKLINHIKINNFNFLFFYSLLSLLFINIAFYRIAEHGTDRFPQILLILIFLVFFETLYVEKKGEIILINSHISQYKEANKENHNPTDDRKLLLNKREINKLIGKMQREGFTIVPTKMYFKKGKAKIEIAIAKGKKKFDKRSTKKERDWNRDKARYIRKSS